jgi:hypothetical protein
MGKSSASAASVLLGTQRACRPFSMGEALAAREVPAAERQRLDESPAPCDGHVRTCGVNGAMLEMASQKLAMANFQGNQACAVSRPCTRSSRRRLDDECVRDSGLSPGCDAQALDETVGWPGTHKSWPWPTWANSTADCAPSGPSASMSEGARTATRFAERHSSAGVLNANRGMCALMTVTGSETWPWPTSVHSATRPICDASY